VRQLTWALTISTVVLSFSLTAVFNWKVHGAFSEVLPGGSTSSVQVAPGVRQDPDDAADKSTPPNTSQSHGKSKQ